MTGLISRNKNVPSGGIFLGDISLADFDPGFFGIENGEAAAMDPNQRQCSKLSLKVLKMQAFR